MGLVITQTMKFIGMLQWGMKQSVFLEMYTASLARVINYSKLDEEPALDSNLGTPKSTRDQFKCQNKLV